MGSPTSKNRTRSPELHTVMRQKSPACSHYDKNYSILAVRAAGRATITSSTPCSSSLAETDSLLPTHSHSRGVAVPARTGDGGMIVLRGNNCNYKHVRSLHHSGLGTLKANNRGSNSNRLPPPQANCSLIVWNCYTQLGSMSYVSN